ncbi:hypothetical protein K438DRAFT_2054933, partial [Mycena galopus ATCC 62051]
IAPRSARLSRLLQAAGLIRVVVQTPTNLLANHRALISYSPWPAKARSNLPVLFPFFSLKSTGFPTNFWPRYSLFAGAPSPLVLENSGFLGNGRQSESRGRRRDGDGMSCACPMLVVFQVCAARHRNVYALWSTPSHIDKAIRLLQSTLARGGTSPLNVTLIETLNYPFPSAVFDMLAAHSQRWQTLLCSMSLIGAFSSIHGKLPRLQSLEIDFSPDESALEILDSLPSLTSLGFPVQFLLDNISKFPLETLTKFKCVVIDSDDTYQALFSMSLLPAGIQFHFTLHLMDDLEELLEADLPSLTSNISTFYMQFGAFDVPVSKVALSGICQNLTLPLLTKLELESDSYPRQPLL